MEPAIGEIRQSNCGYQILISFQEAPGGSRTREDWVPYATHFVTHSLLDLPDRAPVPMTIADALEQEGWIRPESALADPILCLEDPPRARFPLPCLRRLGHDGSHRSGAISWT